MDRFIDMFIIIVIVPVLVIHSISVLVNLYRLWKIIKRWKMMNKKRKKLLDEYRAKYS